MVIVMAVVNQVVTNLAGILLKVVVGYAAKVVGDAAMVAMEVAGEIA